MRRAVLICFASLTAHMAGDITLRVIRRRNPKTRIHESRIEMWRGAESAAACRLGRSVGRGAWFCILQKSYYFHQIQRSQAYRRRALLPQGFVYPLIPQYARNLQMDPSAVGLMGSILGSCAVSLICCFKESLLSMWRQIFDLWSEFLESNHTIYSRVAALWRFRCCPAHRIAIHGTHR